MKNKIIYLSITVGIIVPLYILCTSLHNDKHIETKTVETIGTILYIPEIKIEAPIFNRTELLKPLFSTLDQMVQEKIPFDEPRVEVGQQDGELRPLWKTAWRKNKGRYYHNGEVYYTQDAEGRPLPPQVCIDFIVDSFDRMGGNWWIKTDKKGYKVNGINSLSEAISSQSVAEDVKLDKRRIADVIAFFDLSPELFQKIIRDENDGPKASDTNKIKEYLITNDVQPGDIVFILGRAKWDNYQALHWHSFFIRSHVGSDWTIVGNSVMVAERNLVTELKRTPRRKIWAIYRPTNKFLYNVINNKELNN